MKKWTRQPPPGTNQIDWANPITNGLKFFASFHEGFPYEYVKREHGIPGSAWRGMDPVDGVMAMTINDLDGKNNAVTFPKHDEIYAGISECTIMCFTRNRLSTVAAGQRPYGHMGTGNDPFYMTVDNTGNITVVLLTTVSSYNSTGAQYTLDGVDIDRWALWGGTWKNDALTGRWQRRKDSSPTVTSGVMATPDVNADNVPRVGFANVGGTNSWNGWVAFSAFWDRALSDAEWNSMVDNPWQVFKPPRNVALVDVPEDHHLIYNEGLYQGVHGYTVDFRKMAPGTQWVGAASDTYKTHGVLATGDSHTFTVRQSEYGPALTCDNDAVAIPQLFLSPSYFGSFGPHQFSEAEIFITGGVVSDAWCGVSVFNGGDRAVSLINHMYAVLTTNIGTGGTATYRLYKYTGSWSFVNAATEVDPSLQPVRLRIEARDQGDAVLVDWWINGKQQTQWVDNTDTRITSKSTVIPHTAPGIAYGHNGAFEQSRFIYWFRGGALPEIKHAPDFTVPVNEDLPELGTFEKPWDDMPL